MTKIEEIKENIRRVKAQIGNPTLSKEYRDNQKRVLKIYEENLLIAQEEENRVKNISFKQSKEIKADIEMMLYVHNATGVEVTEGTVYALASALENKYGFPFEFFVKVTREVATAYYNK